ncbi:scarecrow-like protein 3 [Panicum virgatum]|uniref:scarecrow-like protein 3 n=1 Tax=Panicum virgatum TaxID=38727 RepID=UPI0019D5B980|nr:scarecrow-like protein 3 [Panicum virgatum]
MVPVVAAALIDPSDHLDRRCVRAARRSFFELSPFPKAAVAVANRFILEAMENEKNVHVIDFAGPAAQPCQWVQLLRDFHSQPEGAPHLRLTIVHDDGEFLAKVSESLADEADELDVPFQVHCVAGQIETLDLNDLHGVLGLKSGEARAIVCTTRLHRLLAAADDAASSSSLSSVGHHSNQMAASIARLQQMAASGSCPATICGAACEDDDGDPYRSPATPLGFVSPPLTTPPFQMMPAALEAGHNGASFRKRFAEALRYYAAAYDSLDAAAAARRRPAAERAEVERAVLGEEVRDVLLREGSTGCSSGLGAWRPPGSAAWR